MHGSSLLFLVILVIVFYFLLIMPQRRQQKKKAQMMKQLRPGARVMTASGIYADIAEMHDDIIVARIAEDVEIEMDTRAVVRVVSEGPVFDEADEEMDENEDGHLLGAPDEYEDSEELEDDEETGEEDSEEDSVGDEEHNHHDNKEHHDDAHKRP